MPATKECPMCGADMQYREETAQARVPGNRNASTHTVREWVCPECDYFEEADEEI